MRKALLGGILAVAAVGAAPAHGGCWATVSLAPPQDVAAGATWTARMTVLQHGRTPLAGATPRVTIVNAETGTRRTFAARPSGRGTGRYDARVVFPSGGTWRYEVSDGFTRQGGEPVPCARTHTFAAIEVDGPALRGSSGGPFAVWPLAGGAAALLALAAAIGLLVRRHASREPAAA